MTPLSVTLRFLPGNLMEVSSPNSTSWSSFVRDVALRVVGKRWIDSAGVCTTFDKADDVNASIGDAVSEAINSKALAA
jgi:hypothetical protein